jgi:hypothetical protein
VDENAVPVDEQAAQPSSGRPPSLLEIFARSRNVWDRQMKPFHPSRNNRSFQICDPQQTHLVLFNQRDDGSSSPPTHRV